MRATPGYRSSRLFVVVLAHLLGGCGFSAGDAPTDGRGEAAATLPSCLEALFAACPTDGICHSSAADGGQPIRSCFASGAQADITQVPGCAGEGHSLVQMRKADGAPCYTVEVRLGTICESEGFTWKDPSGRVVATGENDTGLMVTCAEGGPRVSCASSSQCYLGSQRRHDDCQAGSCP